MPSKIFEYVALGKPIVAGLSGYSANFLREKVPYANLFAPGDFDGAYEAVMKSSERELTREVVAQFVNSYSRESIMDKMAEHIMRLIMSNIKAS